MTDTVEAAMQNLTEVAADLGITPATNGDAGPDVDAWFKAERAKLADEERALTKAQADLAKALVKEKQARAAIRIFTGFIEGRTRGIAHTEKLLAKGDGK